MAGSVFLFMLYALMSSCAHANGQCNYNSLYSCSSFGIFTKFLPDLFSRILLVIIAHMIWRIFIYASKRRLQVYQMFIYPGEAIYPVTLNATDGLDVFSYMFSQSCRNGLGALKGWFKFEIDIYFCFYNR